MTEKFKGSAKGHHRCGAGGIGAPLALCPQGEVGIRARPTAPGSSWQNGHAERLIGSIRRECLDHIIVLDENHLYRILKTYADYCNEDQPHLALGKDAPNHRPIQRQGPIMARPIIGRLHHNYARM